MSDETKKRPIQRQLQEDAKGRLWHVAIVDSRDADAEDARFWYEELTPAERVMAVEECTRSAWKARGLGELPPMRRVARVVRCRPR